MAEEETQAIESKKKTIKELAKEAQGALFSKTLILETKIKNLNIEPEQAEDLLFLLGKIEEIALSYSETLRFAHLVCFYVHSKKDYIKYRGLLSQELYKIYKSRNRETN